ncbi:hypothetical protein B842_03360 [Corynebacterium humireducens NBRC 106098 = DSM 45392]|uniref:Phage head morphogenesis domain-containing protein n=1 Tax=Corynebacterium humireducens NBRC 106098 = DSM 45392 TaxID=1223515 RepID=A0A0B5D126_9CORY|nr:phage minor head protein [Corynebacterium humireducens]AJE32525.1 hypothetical protein B842_03360 [Corynebacterium humireducens NBRC 106098 = DSM 45392]
MPVFLDDPFDTWTPIIDQAIMHAINTWLRAIDAELHPVMLADASDDSLPNLEALLAAITAWHLVIDDEVLPLLVGLTARRLIDMSTARGMTWEQLATTPPSGGAVTDLVNRAVDALTRAGVPTVGFDQVLWVPSWVDFIDAYARQTVNLVQGMPETAYRDLVTKLASATREGMAPWERARLARDYLDITTEGGYEQWMTRAHRISRTETNRIINAADLQAARTEATTTGEELHKVWVCGIDTRTRDSHFAADGQRVPLDGKFLIGGHEADYPGDPHLPPHESINCRCTTIILTSDEPLPDESDRQTERERSDGTVRDPQAEVRRRAADGVTRARDSEPQPVTAAVKETTPMRTTWSGLLAPINKPTGDGRIIDPDATIEFREFPMPLLFQRATSGGHDTAVVVGKISAATVDAHAIHATGELFDTPDGIEAQNLLAEGVIRPSVDMCDMVTEWQILDADGNPVDPDDADIEWSPEFTEVMHVRACTIMAATLVSKPAFAEAKITIGDQVPAPADADAETAALVAAATIVEDTAPAEAFSDPGLPGPTALTVTDDGHVYGHLALWGTEHVGMPGRGVTPPHSRTDYALFHVSTVITDTGPLPCGRLTVGCGHAEPRYTAPDATAHYDQTGTCWAYVRAGEDAHGIWVAGIINPDADAATVRAGASAPLSGDWRNVGGNLELVAALSVNTPGFPVPRSFSATHGEELSLVAAAVVPRRTRDDRLADAVAEGIRRHEQRRATEAATTQRQTQARTLAAQVLSSQVQRERP